MSKVIERIKERAKLIKFCSWLEQMGYLDDDWWREEPHAVDEYLKTQPKG